jgi:Flp pilus assembly pilin Flp
MGRKNKTGLGNTMRLKSTKGATLTEYAVIIALMGIVAIVSLSLLGLEVLRSFTATEEQIADNVDGNGALPGPGGGGQGVVPTRPSENNRTCVVDAAGPDSMQEATGRNAYTFPGDCLQITTDGDVAFSIYDDFHPGVAYHARIDVGPGSFNSVGFNGGTGHTFVHERGDVYLAFPLSTGVVWADHTAWAGIRSEFLGQRDVSLTFPDGSNLYLQGLYVDPASGMEPLGSDITVHFADRSVSSTALKPLVFAAVTTPGDDEIEGTDTDDVVILDEGGNDTLTLYGGLDTIQWRSGSVVINADVIADVDTLDMSDTPIGSVARAVVGMDYVVTAPGGRTARIAFGNISGASTSKGVDRIVFSDAVVETADLPAWFAGP